VNTDVPSKGTETPVTTVSDGKVAAGAKGTGEDVEILKSSVEEMKKENESLKEKIQLLETAAMKLLERKLVLKEFVKDLTDKDILDDAKFEVAKLKAENAFMKKELNNSSVNIAEIDSVLDGETLKQLKKEIDEKAFKQLGKNKK